MLLGPGESMLRSAYAVARSGEGSTHGPHGPGVLYLTTQRVVFEAPVGGGRIVRRSVPETETQLDVSLYDVRNVTIRGGRVGKKWLVLELPDLRPAFDLLEPDSWSGSIAQAKRALSPIPRPGGASVHTIERQVVKVRCRYCGALGNEVAGRCPLCGAPL